MIPSNFRNEILAIRTHLCALGTKGLLNLFYIVDDGEFPILLNLNKICLNMHFIWLE